MWLPRSWDVGKVVNTRGFCQKSCGKKAYGQASAQDRTTRCQHTLKGPTFRSTGASTTSRARGFFAPTCTFRSGVQLTVRRYSLRFSNATSPPEIDSLEGIELEYAEDGELHPSSLLGEAGGSRGAHQTSPDLGLKVIQGRGLVLVESKLAEHSFYKCSAWRHEGSSRLPGNPDSDRCNNSLAVLGDYVGQCHQHHPEWGRRYWEHVAPIAVEEALAAQDIQQLTEEDLDYFSLLIIKR